MIKITQLFTYPIKSCAGVSLPNAFVNPLGLKFDRKFVLVDRYGKFLSQRREPKMCLIKVQITEESLIVSYGSSSRLIVSLSPQPLRDLKLFNVDIWGKVGYGIDVGGYASTWFSDNLGFECRLLRYDFRNPRKRNDAAPGAQPILLGFADGFPVTIASQSSLDDLNGRLKEPVTMDRFRPNIVIAGDLQPFEEDFWTVVDLGSVRFKGERPCKRCSIPSIDPTTGVLDKSEKAEPLATLETYRRMPADSKAGPVYFAKNLSIVRTGMLSVGNQLIGHSNS